MQRGLSEREVSRNGVDRWSGRIDRSMVEPARPFARVAQTREHPRATCTSNQRGPQEPLEVQCQVWLTPGHRRPQPLPHPPSPAPAPEVSAWILDDLVHGRVAGEQRHPFRIHNPRDPAYRPSCLQPRHRWQGVHDVAERTRLDDEQRARGFDLQAAISQLPDDPPAASANLRRGSSSARCECRTPVVEVR